MDERLYMNNRVVWSIINKQLEDNRNTVLVFIEKDACLICGERPHRFSVQDCFCSIIACFGCVLNFFVAIVVTNDRSGLVCPECKKEVHRMMVNTTCAMSYEEKTQLLQTSMVPSVMACILSHLYRFEHPDESEMRTCKWFVEYYRVTLIRRSHPPDIALPLGSYSLVFVSASPDRGPGPLPPHHLDIILRRGSTARSPWSSPWVKDGGREDQSARQHMYSWSGLDGAIPADRQLNSLTSGQGVDLAGGQEDGLAGRQVDSLAGWQRACLAVWQGYILAGRYVHSLAGRYIENQDCRQVDSLSRLKRYGVAGGQGDGLADRQGDGLDGSHVSRMAGRHGGGPAGRPVDGLNVGQAASPPEFGNKPSSSSTTGRGNNLRRPTKSTKKKSKVGDKSVAVNKRRVEVLDEPEPEMNTPANRINVAKGAKGAAGVKRDSNKSIKQTDQPAKSIGKCMIASNSSSKDLVSLSKEPNSSSKETSSPSLGTDSPSKEPDRQLKGLGEPRLFQSRCSALECIQTCTFECQRRSIRELYSQMSVNRSSPQEAPTARSLLRSALMNYAALFPDAAWVHGEDVHFTLQLRDQRKKLLLLGFNSV